jgi:EAL domain-containing protein (putative c-di-GMP-specific phosphodiesterase class I)
VQGICRRQHAWCGGLRQRIARSRDPLANPPYGLLSYLQRFPFDKIKIDRCFVTDIAQPDGSSSIVQAVVNIASARNMTTTAEGVETEAQKELLRALGCTEMQGYLFSAAKPAAEVRRLLMGPGRLGAVA